MHPVTLQRYALWGRGSVPRSPFPRGSVGTINIRSAPSHHLRAVPGACLTALIPAPLLPEGGGWEGGMLVRGSPSLSLPLRERGLSVSVSCKNTKISCATLIHLIASSPHRLIASSPHRLIASTTQRLNDSTTQRLNDSTPLPPTSPFLPRPISVITLPCAILSYP
jgi:hypothetical protein